MQPNPGVTISPLVYARTGGVCYLIIIVAGIFGELFVKGKLIVADDATATANNILASESLWRMSIAAELMMFVCGVGLTLVFYVLLRPVHRYLALLAVFFSLVSIAIEAANKLNLFATLLVLGDAPYLQAFDAQQLHALAYLTLKAHNVGFGISLVFFGCECLVLGYLIIRSGYIPKILGVLLQIAGLSYLINSFAAFISPDFASVLFPAILLPPFIAELSMCGWLLVKGVDLQKWNERVGIG